MGPFGEISHINAALLRPEAWVTIVSYLRQHCSEESTRPLQRRAYLLTTGVSIHACSCKPHLKLPVSGIIPAPAPTNIQDEKAVCRASLECVNLLKPA